MKERFEDLLADLNKIVKELESGELSLEDSIEKYKSGMELSAKCRGLLENAKDVVIKKMEEFQKKESE